MSQPSTVFFFTALIAAIASGPAAVYVEKIRAEERQADEQVRILVLQKKPPGITPGALTVKRGTTLIWFNKDPEPVTVAFEQPLGPACKMPVNYFSNIEGIFETGLIPQSGIASLCIVQAGSYDYKVWRLVSKPGEKPAAEVAAGKIIVE